MSKLTKSAAWTHLQDHRRAIDGRRIVDLFADDPGRFDRFSLEAAGILLDYSKNSITDETQGLLMDLARDANVEGWRARLFAGENVNVTENKPALHHALRESTRDTFPVEGENVMSAIHAVLVRMGTFAEAVRDGNWVGATGEAITDVVNIGIGGSDLGPRMAVAALSHGARSGLRIHFISGVGGEADGVLDGLSWAHTLFIVSSKSFTTADTYLNAEKARSWLFAQSGRTDVLARHFVAATAQKDKALAFGISPENVFEFWDWVGGRYSIWSSVGLSMAIAIGRDDFMDFLEGGRRMDAHFCEAPLDRNMPVILALLGIWHTNFFDAQTHAIIPYDHRLKYFPAYIQQLDMESNGKCIDRDKNAVDYATAPVIWGTTGTDCQHSFFQRLHQGTGLVPADFIAAAEPGSGAKEDHDVLLANFLAQTQALMRGKTDAEVRAEMNAEGINADDVAALLPHKIFPGNRPTNTLLFRRLEPATLGALIALYEHKVFVQAMIWNINPFDQWGVELGKALASGTLSGLRSASASAPTGHDASTVGLIAYLKGSTGA